MDGCTCGRKEKPGIVYRHRIHPETAEKEVKEMDKANNDVREYAKNHGVYLWEVAQKCGLNDGNFSRKLRVELPLDKKMKIYGIINQIVEERSAT